MNDMAKNLLLWLVIAAILLAVFQSFYKDTTAESLDYSDFIEQVRSDRIREVTIEGLKIEGMRRDGSQFVTTRPMLNDNKLVDDLYNHNVQFRGREPEPPSLWQQLLVASFPILLIIAVFMSFRKTVFIKCDSPSHLSRAV